MEGLSGECRRLARDLLRCRERLNPADNTSTPVCELRDPGEDRLQNAAVQDVFLAVIGVTVTLALVLNLVVILTIVLNRELHTLVNYLTSLLCFNQLVWIVVPMLEIKLDNFLVEGLCTLRHYILLATTSINFGLVVTITLLRYLMVVRNHSYPPNMQNMALFTMIAILPCACRLMLFRQSDNGLCGHFIAETPDGYIINTVPTRQRQLRTFLILVTEHIIGLAALGFSYARILVKALGSRRRMHVHASEKQEQSQPSRPGLVISTADERSRRHSSSVAHRPEDSKVEDSPPPGPSSRQDLTQTLCTSTTALVPPPVDTRSKACTGVLLSAEELQDRPITSTSTAVSTHLGSTTVSTHGDPTSTTNGHPRGRAPTIRRTTSSGRSARTDIVATMAMVAFLVTFIFSFTPYVALIYYEKERDLMCLMMPDTRMYLMMVVIVSGGITAVFNPLVCVVFSRDFRKSFFQTKRKLASVW